MIKSKVGMKEKITVFDALYDHLDKLNHVLVRHEQGAAHAAQGFARVSGKVGVCLVTSGPGATNTITGVADAMIDSTPIVVIAGQVGAGLLGTDAFQEVDLVGVTQPITKWSYQIRRAEDVAWAVARAFYIARSGRPGPVVLDFAKNAQTEMTEYEPVDLDFIRSYDPDPETDPKMVAEAVRLINEAQKPLVLVGQGVELGNAQEELRAFVEKGDMPCGCTLLGLSALPSGHRLNKGMLGMHGNLGPNVKTNEWPGTFPSRRAAFMLDNCHDITLEDITIATTLKGQAEGLLLNGERIALYRVHVIGSGDALQANGTIYMEACQIDGDGDTILGRGSLFAYRCDLRNSGGPFSWVRNTAGNHGDVFVECTFSCPDGHMGDYGRTKTNHGSSYPDAEFVVIDCRVKNIIPEGWSSIGERTARMYEHNTRDLDTGKPVDVSRRHPYSRQLDAVRDAALLRNYRNPAFVLKGWQPQSQLQ